MTQQVINSQGQVKGATALVDSQNGVDITSTAAETTLYTYTVPANTLGAIGGLRFFLFGDYLKNNGVADTWTFRLKFGATTLVTSAAFSPGTSAVVSAARQPWSMDVGLANRNATNSQGLSAFFRFAQRSGGSDNNPSTFFSNVVDSMSSIHATSAEDTTAAKAFTITVQWSASSANNSLRSYHAAATLL